MNGSSRLFGQRRELGLNLRLGLLEGFESAADEVGFGAVGGDWDGVGEDQLTSATLDENDVREAVSDAYSLWQCIGRDPSQHQ
jgi:hypothetical protein